MLAEVRKPHYLPLLNITSGKLKLKTRGVLYPAHSGGSDELLSVQVAITKLELKVGLAKVKNRFGTYVWKVMGIK